MTDRYRLRPNAYEELLRTIEVYGNGRILAATRPSYMVSVPTREEVEEKMREKLDALFVLDTKPENLPDFYDDGCPVCVANRKNYEAVLDTKPEEPTHHYAGYEQWHTGTKKECPICVESEQQ